MDAAKEQQSPSTSPEQKRVEESLRQIQMLVENSRDAIIGEALDGTITSWNGGAVRMFGYAPEEVIGKSVLVLLPPELKDEVPALLAKIGAGEAVVDYDSVRVRKDGERIAVALSISPIKTDAGVVIGASVVERDISRRKQVERENKELTVKLRQSLGEMEQKVKDRTLELEAFSKENEVLLESIGDGLVAIDNDWVITVWNSAAEKITGWSRDEAIGQTFRNVVRFVRSSDHSEYVRFISDAMLDGKVHSMEVGTLVIRKDGTELDVSDSAAPILDANGRVKGVIVVFRDTSKEREVQRAKNDLVALVTHELRGPASHIAGHLDLLQGALKGNSDPLIHSHLAGISAANGAINGLADSLNDVFRVHFGDFFILPELADVEQIGESVLKQQELSIAGKKLRIEKEYEAGLPALNVDKQLVGLVFSNLVSNAVKYTPDGGLIRLAIRKSGTDLMITVSDMGFGIPKEEQAKIFGNFFRASNARAIAGIGAGLHVVKAMLERAGCKIWFESEENKGTTFFVTIPLAGMGKVSR